MNPERADVEQPETDETGLMDWVRLGALTTGTAFVAVGVTVTVVGILRSPLEWFLWLFQGSGLVHDISVITMFGIIGIVGISYIWVDACRKK